MQNQNDDLLNDPGKYITQTAENLIKQGIPPKFSAYASAMGYMRATGKKR
jgi:hypothetical protein